jgi:hypothetical protein
MTFRKSIMLTFLWQMQNITFSASLGVAAVAP